MKPDAFLFFSLCGLMLLLPVLDWMMRRDRPVARVERLLRQRTIGRIPHCAGYSLAGFVVGLVAAASPSSSLLIAAGIATWAAVVIWRVRRAERLLRDGVATNGRITDARLERRGLEVDYAFDSMRSRHQGSLVVTDALVVASICDDPSVLVYYDARRPRLHVAFLARELEDGSGRVAVEPSGGQPSSGGGASVRTRSVSAIARGS